MTAEPLADDLKPEVLRGRAVEQAAVGWVMDFERRAGREPVDRRFDKAFPGDIESPPRIIEIKATGTTYRGWFLPLEPIQYEHLGTESFYIYVVENVAQGDPARFTLRVLDPQHLEHLRAGAVERRYYEMSWPTKDYDATPIEPAG